MSGNKHASGGVSEKGKDKETYFCYSKCSKRILVISNTQNILLPQRRYIIWRTSLRSHARRRAIIYIQVNDETVLCLRLIIVGLNHRAEKCRGEIGLIQE
jgi:hypothetical protein